MTETKQAVLELCDMVDACVRACHGSKTELLDWATDSVGMQFQADRVRQLVKNSEQMSPPIDATRFNKGPMTDEQCALYLGKWLLVVVEDEFGDDVHVVAHPWKLLGCDTFVIDCAHEDRFTPSEVKMWYPLPELA